MFIASIFAKSLCIRSLLAVVGSFDFKNMFLQPIRQCDSVYHLIAAYEHSTLAVNSVGIQNSS